MTLKRSGETRTGATLDEFFTLPLRLQFHGSPPISGRVEAMTDFGLLVQLRDGPRHFYAWHAIKRIEQEEPR